MTDDNPLDPTPTIITPNEGQPPFAQRFAHFLSRSDKIYATSPLTILSERGIENRLFDNMVEYLPEGVIIAGGFVTSVILEDDKAKDIDLFFTSEVAFRAMVEVLTRQRTPEEKKEDWAFDGYQWKDGVAMDLDKLGDTRFIVFTHPKRPSIQLLRMVWYDSAEHVIDSFDLTVVQFAAHRDGLTYNPAAWLDLSRKRLVLHRMQFPSSTLRRLIKYAAKGFYACPGSLVTICEAIQAFRGEPDVNDVVYVD